MLLRATRSLGCRLVARRSLATDARGVAPVSTPWSGHGLSGVCVAPPDTTAGLLWLHGLGDSHLGFEDMFLHVGLPGFKVIIPDAPERPITLNGGMTMRAWYDLTSLEPEGRANDKEGIEESARQIAGCVEDLQKEFGNRVFIGGFSQGGAMAAHVGLRHNTPLAGIVAYSGYLLSMPEEVASPDTPLLAAHGKQDAVVPFEYARDSWEPVKKVKGNKFSWNTGNHRHEMTLNEVGLLVSFLTEKSVPCR